jgi:flagellar basal-body rod protein FlgB
VFQDVTSVALHSAMRGLAARQRAVADNVANVNTPGFLASRVSFESALLDAVRGGAAPAVQPTVSRSLEPTRINGNNVNLDRETLIDVETGLRYQLAVRAMDGKFAALRTVIGGG